jgi:hypothetical protein
VRSNQPNNPTFVDIDFFNESDALPSTTNPNFERLLSESVSFVCWQQFGLTTGTDAGLLWHAQGDRDCRPGGEGAGR